MQLKISIWRAAKPIAFILGWAVLSGSSLSSPPDILWTKTFGGLFDDYGCSVLVTRDGGYIIGGYTHSFSDDSSSDLYLMKTDSVGNTLWRVIYGGPDWPPFYSKDYGYSLAETKDRGIVIAGCTYPYGASNAQVYLVKVNRKGNFLWEHTYGGGHGNAACATRDGDCIIAGTSLIKVDRYGDTLWTKAYAGEMKDIKVTSDGGFIIARQFKGRPCWHINLIKTDSLGDTVWTKTYERPLGDFCFSVLETKDRGYIVAGQSIVVQMPSNSDVSLIKTDSAGTLLWQKFYGGPADDCGYCIAPTSDGGFIVAGKTKSFGAGSYDIYLVRTDSLGDTLWTRTIGGDGWDEGHSVVETKDGGCIVAGWTRSFGLGGADIYLVKLDPAAGITESVERRAKSGELKILPSPARNSFQIKFTQPNAGFVSLKIFDAGGRLVKTLIQARLQAGEHTVKSSTTGLASGVYFIELKQYEKRVTEKLLVLR